MPNFSAASDPESSLHSSDQINRGHWVDLMKSYIHLGSQIDFLQRKDETRNAAYLELEDELRHQRRLSEERDELRSNLEREVKTMEAKYERLKEKYDTLLEVYECGERKWKAQVDESRIKCFQLELELKKLEMGLTAEFTEKLKSSGRLLEMGLTAEFMEKLDEKDDILLEMAKKNESLESQNSEMMKKNENLQRQKDATILEMGKKNENLERLNSEMMLKIENLQRQKDATTILEMGKKNDNLERLNSEMVLKIENLQRQKDATILEMGKKNVNLERLNSEMMLKIENLQRLKDATILEMGKKNDNLERMNSEMMLKIENLQRQKDATILEMMNKVESLESENSEMMKKNESLERQNSEMKNLEMMNKYENLKRQNMVLRPRLLKVENLVEGTAKEKTNGCNVQDKGTANSKCSAKQKSKAATSTAKRKSKAATSTAKRCKFNALTYGKPWEEQISEAAAYSAKLWEDAEQMREAFKSDDELCMKAVCALYRKHKSLGVWEDQSNGNEGFSKEDYLSVFRGVALGEILTGRDPDGEMMMSVAELERADQNGLLHCKLIAEAHVQVLFEIYINNQDPLFVYEILD